MRLHRLAITAFGPFGGRHEVDFDELSAAGLFLLHGPTGAGKTSVLDAVCYGLYGSVPGARQGSGLTPRSDHADPHTLTEVVLELTVGGRRLEITRRPQQPRPKRSGEGFTTERAFSALRERTADGAGWKPLSRSHQEIGEEIGQLLGMSKEQFCQVVLLPQGDFARFLRADAEARGKLLGRLFDTGRFAAVEERLAELRRGAEKRVVAGDERLLALAHRMAQAAGDSAGLRDPQLIDLGAASPAVPGQRAASAGAGRGRASAARAGGSPVPGEPGLADAVLEWAAVARTSARERCDIAAGAVRTAEAAHAVAGETLDAVRELSRQQRRHTQARSRADDLEARRPDHDRTRDRLDRARAAEAVTPALDLRDAAEREHRTAATAERDARARLAADPDPGEAAVEEVGADGLAALERQVREELGSLAAARRAERRAGAIAAESAELDRDARADEETIQEAAEWLAGWESVRVAHQRRIEAAQEAVTRAEQFGGRIEPAEQRLAAARRRDGLAAEDRVAEERLLAAREGAAAARQTWLDLKERRLRGIAAELAAGLRAGEACAVCGSVEHPRPARLEAGHVDRAREEDARHTHDRAEAAREETAREAQAVRESLAVAAAGADGGTVDELTTTVAALRAAFGEARSAAADGHDARQALDSAEAERDRRRAQQQDAERRAAGRTSHRDALTRERAALEEELAQARVGAATVAERAVALERQAGLLSEAAEAARTAEVAARRLKEADARLADAAYRAGFETPQAAADAVLSAAGQREAQHALDRWRNESVAVLAELSDPEVLAASRAAPADLGAAQAALDAATRRLREASAADDAARSRRTALDGLSAQATDDARRLAPLREEHERVARLASLAAGTSADNERKMRLEAYVLAARLEQVAAAASVRLAHMSAGRYTLVHSDARAGGRGRSGLGLHVIDSWTGSERDTATLSGGETFFASLSLALGLADVVTDEAGGTRLNTLFIDEGFGSLDEQTLDEVLDVLDSLRERDRTVGLVSHVADLRRRIPTQLEVVKDRTGSAVRHRTPRAAAPG